MKSTTTSVTETTLVLDEEERMWLRGYLQNPQNVDCVELENPVDTKMREKFFSACKGEPTKRKAFES